jgi:hypothetical protein
MRKGLQWSSFLLSIFFVKILFSNLYKCSIESEAKKAGMESLTRRDSPKKNQFNESIHNTWFAIIILIGKYNNYVTLISK